MRRRGMNWANTLVEVRSAEAEGWSRIMFQDLMCEECGSVGER